MRGACRRGRRHRAARSATRPGARCAALLGGALLLLGTLTGAPLRANPFDTYGFTSRAIAMGGAATAAATDLDAAFYNPAAVIRTRDVAVGLGLLVADDFLASSGDEPNLRTHVLFEGGLAAPLPLGETLRERVFVSLAVAVPHTGFYDVDQPDDESVTFPFWDSRNRRVVFTGALAVRVFDWLGLGIGTTLLPDVRGTVQVDLSGSADRNASRVEVDYDFAPTAGLLVEPLPWLAIGVTYRGAHSTQIDLPVDVSITENLTVAARVTAPAYALPHEVAVGVQVRPLDVLTLTADATWYDYSSFRYASPDVTVYDANGDPTNEGDEGKAARVAFEDVVAVRAGAEWAVLPWLLLRAGYGFQPSPVPAQSGRTNLLDGDRHVVALGAGIDLPAAWLWEDVTRLAVDLHLQVTALGRREFEKDALDPENPGYPSISVSGGTFSAGASVRLWF